MIVNIEIIAAYCAVATFVLELFILIGKSRLIKRLIKKMLLNLIIHLVQIWLSIS